MECYCIRTCFIRHETPKDVLYEKGKVYSFRKCPPDFFVPVNKVEIDFSTATKELLLSSEDWRIEDLRQYLKEEYGLNVSPRIGRDKIVEKLFDAKYREV